jgi:hypothetical protein
MTDAGLPFFLPVNRGSGGEALCAFRAVNAPTKHADLLQSPCHSAGRGMYRTSEPPAQVTTAQITLTPSPMAGRVLVPRMRSPAGEG